MSQEALPKRPRGDQLPIRPVAEAVATVLKGHGPLSVHTTGGKRTKNPEALPRPAEALAEQLGLSPSYIDRMLEPRGGLRQKWIGFDMADRILVGIDRVDLWFRDPELNRYYTGGVVDAADRLLPPHRRTKAA